MGFWSDMFGQSKKEIWDAFSKEIGGEFREGGFFGKDVVTATRDGWRITLDTYTVSTGKSSTTYTRIRAPYKNKDNFFFRIYRAGFFSELGKTFGMMDVEIGDSVFDDEFIIKGNNEEKIKQLFSNSRIRRLVSYQPRIDMKIKNDEGWFGGAFPEGVDELYFQAVGIIKDINLLEELFELFFEVLNQLYELDSAEPSDYHIDFY